MTTRRPKICVSVTSVNRNRGQGTALSVFCLCLIFVQIFGKFFLMSAVRIYRKRLTGVCLFNLTRRPLRILPCYPCPPTSGQGNLRHTVPNRKGHRGAVFTPLTLELSALMIIFSLSQLYHNLWTITMKCFYLCPNE